MTSYIIYSLGFVAIGVGTARYIQNTPASLAACITLAVLWHALFRLIP